MMTTTKVEMHATPQKGGNMREEIEFTQDEKIALAEAMKLAASGIAKAWDVLAQIGLRIGKDWEPEQTNVADIAEYIASGLNDPDDLSGWEPELTAENFSDPENWKAPRTAA